MPDAYIFTGQILPERHRFALDGQRLYIKDADRGIDACLLLGVIDNQLTAKLFGRIDHLSNTALKDIVSQAMQGILSSVAFITGRLFELDLISVVKEDKRRSDGSIQLHYFDNAHEIVTDRRFSITADDLT